MTTARPDLRRATALARGWRLDSVAAGLVLGTLVAVLLPESFTPPQLRSVQPVEVPTSCVIAAFVAVSIAPTISEPSREIRLLANGYRRHLGVLRVAAATALAILLLGAADTGHALSAAAALLTVVGEYLLVARYAGLAIGWIVPIVHLLAAMTIGAGVFGDLAWWAWPAANAQHLSALVVPAAIWLAGLLAHWSLRSSRVTQLIGDASD